MRKRRFPVLERAARNEAVRRAYSKAKARKAKAYLAMGKAIRNGALKRPERCEHCGEIPRRALHGHHADYAKALDVIWLCPPCHVRQHVKLRAETKEHSPAISIPNQISA